VVAQLVEALCYRLEGCGYDSLKFFTNLILLTALWPLVILASDRIEVPGSFPGQ